MRVFGQLVQVVFDDSAANQSVSLTQMTSSLQAISSDVENATGAQVVQVRPALPV
jgi:hypothetical protein